MVLHARIRPTRALRPLLLAVVATVVALFAGLLAAPPALAATDFGTPSISYSGATHPPTSDKPQSKLWWNDGSWWSTMWTTGSGWHIYRLDRGSESWIDTGVLIDSRSTTLTDALWDGSHLFVAAQVATVSTETSPNVSKTGQPAKLYRYSYSGGRYTLDSGFPSSINNISSETLTIDEDSTGAIWSSWVQISGSSSAGYTATVYVNSSTPGGATWGTPFVVPGASDPHPSVDDISAVVSFQNKIGVMWSDQIAGKVYFALHTDGTSATSSSSWRVLTARSGTDIADDHMNLKTLQSDSSGRVFATLKTSLDLTSNSSSQPQIVLLVYTPGSGTFTTTTVATVGDCETRPQVMLDGEHDILHVFATGPATSVSGCPHSGTPGAIYEKTTSLDNPSFVSGRGTPIIQDGSSLNINNPTTSKQSVNSTTGLVVLASNDTTNRYWFADESLGTPPAAPTASFTVTPSSGTAPVTASFTDTSTGSPTSWAWDFGDGGTATTQNPTHTYTTPGTYTVKLTATNATGSNTATTTGAVTVTAAATAPTASFTMSPSSGTAPVDVAFTDTSTGSPTSWAWDFGDGGTATTQNPTHTYTTPGTYTVKLTATNATGSNTATTTGAVTVTAGGGGTTSGQVTVGSSTTAASSAASTTVTVTQPSGVANGDVLVAALNVNGKPSLSSAPSGWSLLTSPLSVGTNATQYVIYHVVTDAANGPASWSVKLSTAEAWNVGVTDFHGVDTSNPFDSAVATKINSSSSSGITLPGVTTVTPGALVVGGVGIDSASSTIAPPSGWSEVWEADGGQDVALATRPMPTVGATGSTTFALSGSGGATAWMRALRPLLTAGGGATAPTVSFSVSPTSGTAPMDVSFTDTSTGSPTSWAWDFGDGGTATTQNATHTYTTPGTYTVTLTATNATGSDTATQTKAVTVTAAATAPTASFTVTPKSGTAPVDVAFTDTSTGAPTSWAWDFGDGQTATTQNPTHTYSTPGTYTVKLTATNGTGSDTATQSAAVTVTAAARAPTASFTLAPSSGTAPVDVKFTDTSTGSPTSWAWDFGDGQTATTENPTHTYDTPGTYTVTLTATNATGSDTTSQAKAVTVTTGTVAGAVTIGSSSTASSSSAVRTVKVTKPAGVADGDVLVAQLNVNGKPSLTSAPSGWSLLTSPLSVGTGATQFVIYHVVTSAAAEPSSWSVGLSTAEAWNAGITDFHGVDTSNPFDTAAVTKVNTSSSSGITLSGVTTVTPGALVLGGVGMDSATTTVTPPSGWSEAWEADGGQDVALATRPMATPGATGSTTFALNGSGGATAWMRALRPA